MENSLAVIIKLSISSVKGFQMLLNEVVECRAGALLGRGSDLVREGMCRLILAVSRGTPDQISPLIHMA